MKGLRILLLVHAVITFAAGVTLFVVPTAIPGVVGVTVTIVWTFIVFHATTGAGELYAFVRGTGATILGNLALRLLMVMLFAQYGLRRRAPPSGPAGSRRNSRNPSDRSNSVPSA